MSFKISFLILVFLSITSMCFGEQNPLYSKKEALSQLNDWKSLNQNLQFKFTISDSWFGRDKVHHFLTSALLSGVGYYFLHEEQNYSNHIARQGGFGFAISLGLVKEIRDGFKPQNAFSVKDLVADILGTVVGIVIVAD